MPLLVQTVLSEGMSHTGQKRRRRDHPHTETMIHRRLLTELSHPVLCVCLLGNTSLGLVRYWICLFLLSWIDQYLQSISSPSILTGALPFTYFARLLRSSGDESAYSARGGCHTDTPGRNRSCDFLVGGQRRSLRPRRHGRPWAGVKLDTALAFPPPK